MYGEPDSCDEGYVCEVESMTDPLAAATGT